MRVNPRRIAVQRPKLAMESDMKQSGNSVSGNRVRALAGRAST
jgi:hypothetical protein